MGKKRGFIDRSKATTFQLVHRSHRDPEYHNDEASSRVLVAVERPNGGGAHTASAGIGNDRKNIQTGADLAQEFAASTRGNVGQAAEYGIYFDDTSYDYMQHLRPTGNAGAVLLENPEQVKQRERAKRDKAVQFTAVDDLLPREAQPSKGERPQNYQDQQSIQDAVTGFRPELDPRIREVLMALEGEEEPAAEADSEDWFAELAGSGAVGSDEEAAANGADDGWGDYDDDEDDGFASDDTAKAVSTNPRTRTVSAGRNGDGAQRGVNTGSEWEQEFAKFKKAGARLVDEQGSQVSRAFTAASDGRVKWGNGSIGTGFSMSSSALYRNEGLTQLDDRFDRIEREYIPEEDEDEDDLGNGTTTVAHHPNAAAGGDKDGRYEPRSDFDSIMDDFLDEYKNMGQKGATRKARNPYTLDDARIALGNVKIAK